jgi:hypothetical protein
VKSAENTAAVGRQPTRPPPLSQHLREFSSRPDAWAVLARNLIPVIGVYGFAWSAGLTVFNYWFDGLTALAAIIAALVPRALRETQPKSAGLTITIVRGIFTWIFLVGIIGMPYWIVLIPLHTLMLGDNLRAQLTHSPALWTTFASIAASHFWKVFRSGYDEMPDDQLKQRVRWDVYLLMLRGFAMFMMIGFAFFLVPLMCATIDLF